MDTTTELLLHPVRLRIVQAVGDGRTVTTADLCARLPDVSKATVYRQVALLAEGGLLEVVSEERVRGAVERRYRLRRARALIDDEQARAMTLDEHRDGFAAAAVALVAEFGLYLDRPGADPFADSVSYRQAALWLSDDEKAAVIEELRTTLRKCLEHAPSPGRRRYLFSPIFFPVEE